MLYVIIQVITRYDSIYRNIQWPDKIVPHADVISRTEAEPMTTPQRWEDLPLVLTSREVATLLRLHTDTVKRMCRTGRLRAVKVGRGWRIKRDDVLALLEGNVIRGTKGDSQQRTDPPSHE